MWPFGFWFVRYYIDNYGKSSICEKRVASKLEWSSELRQFFKHYYFSGIWKTYLGNSLPPYCSLREETWRHGIDYLVFGISTRWLFTPFASSNQRARWVAKFQVYRITTYLLREIMARNISRSFAFEDIKSCDAWQSERPYFSNNQCGVL